MSSKKPHAPSGSLGSYSKEAVKEFVLSRLLLTPSTMGEVEEDVPSVVRATGGLQFGGHMIELFNRFKVFEPEWFDRWYENFTLVEGHVLRGALRIVNADEYQYYFKATRSVARRRRYQNCPRSLNEGHCLALKFIDKHGPLTLLEFKELFGGEYPQLRERSRRLLTDLYNHGEVARMGRKNRKPLYHLVGKLPYRLEMSRVSEGKAREWLLLKCLGIYGPFTPGDIAHWVGWNLTEAREALNRLLNSGDVVEVRIEGDGRSHYMRAEDVQFLDSLGEGLTERSFVRVLFNDDSLLLGYYPRLGDYFGYPWRYPQFSEGISWRAAILCGRELVGDAVVEMYARSSRLKLRSLTIRKGFASPDVLSKVEEEFSRHAAFQGKDLEMVEPKLV